MNERIEVLLKKETTRKMEIRPLIITARRKVASDGTPVVTACSCSNACGSNYSRGNCSCYNSCGSNFAKNGNCACYTSCGSNYAQ